MITGYDVSKFQDPGLDLAGTDFLIARACYGTWTDDFTVDVLGVAHQGTNAIYDAHIANAKAAGLLTGAYCFGRGSEDPAAQADALLAMAGAVDFLVLDVEADGTQPEMSETQCRAFLARIKASGETRQVWLYHSTSGYPADAYGFDGRWVADYRAIPQPPIPWDLWQFQGDPLDTNRYAGTRDELAVRLGGTAMIDAIAAPNPSPLGTATPHDGTPATRIGGGAGVISVRAYAIVFRGNENGLAVVGVVDDGGFLATIDASHVDQAPPDQPWPAVSTPSTLTTTTSPDGQSVTVTIKGG